MGKFVNENLAKDEKIINRCKISYWTMIVALVGVIIGIVLCVVSSNILKDKLAPLIEKMNSESVLKTDYSYILILAYVFIHLVLTSSFIIPSIVMLPLGCELVVTNKRVIGKSGIFSLHTVDYHITKIASVRIYSSLFGKIFGYMTVQIKGLDGAVRPVNFRGIRNAIGFRNSINEQVEAYEAENRRKQAEEIANANRYK